MSSAHKYDKQSRAKKIGKVQITVLGEKRMSLSAKDVKALEVSFHSTDKIAKGTVVLIRSLWIRTMF